MKKDQGIGGWVLLEHFADECAIGGFVTVTFFSCSGRVQWNILLQYIPIHIYEMKPFASKFLISQDREEYVEVGNSAV